MTALEERPRPSPGPRPQPGRRPAPGAHPAPRGDVRPSPRPRPQQRPPRGLRAILPARATAYVTLFAAIAGFVAMAVWLHARSSETRIDNRVRIWLFQHAGATAQRLLLDLSEPTLTIGVIVLVGLIALLRRRWNVVALCVIGPLLGLVLEAYVLKPIIGRRYVIYFDAYRYPPVGTSAGYAFPSGHETGLACAVVLLAVLLLRTRAGRGLKSAGLAALAVWTGLAALGLVRSVYHYATDTVGGVLLGVIVIVGTSLVIDAVTPRLAPLVAARFSSPGGRARSRTARAA